MDPHLPACSLDSEASGSQFDASSHSVKTTPSLREVKSGQAVRLCAGQPSVLRIAHGRAWLTLTSSAQIAGHDASVLAGDHFLSRGDSLTLLAGQEIVIEPYAIGHAAPAAFSWERVPVALLARPSAMAAAPAEWRSGVAQPLQDVRRAAGLLVRAAGRLLQGLGRSVVGVISWPISKSAIVFVAKYADETAARGLFDIKTANHTPDSALPPASGLDAAATSVAVGFACAETRTCRV